jgi:hypothetical protein
VEASEDGLVFHPVTSCSVVDAVKGLKGMTAEGPLVLSHRVLTYGVSAR